VEYVTHYLRSASDSMLTYFSQSVPEQGDETKLITGSVVLDYMLVTNSCLQTWLWIIFLSELNQISPANHHSATASYSSVTATWVTGNSDHTAQCNMGIQVNFSDQPLGWLQSQRIIVTTIADIKVKSLYDWRSVSISWFRANSGTFDQTLLPV
jgi:hypothetical protein